MGRLPPHAAMTYKTWRKLQELVDGEKINVNGHKLEIATVVAVSKSASLSFTWKYLLTNQI
jgi:hypothetical protein